MKPKNAVRLDRTIGRLVYRIHLFLYRLTRGLVGHHTKQGPILLLTTVGRKSGKERTHPLLYMPEGVRFVVVGSNGGRAETPAWVLNLRADPVARVRAGTRTYTVRGRVLDEADKAAIWPRLTAFYEGWGYYETLTDRTIHPVILEPL